MIYRHKDTGQLYRFLFMSWSVDRQQHEAVYMQMETGRMFNREAGMLDAKFELIEDDTQRDIEPKPDYMEPINDKELEKENWDETVTGSNR